jgi:hypothetical protein
MATTDLRLSQMLYITMFLSSSFHPTNFLTILQNGPLEKGNSKKIQNFPFLQIIYLFRFHWHLSSFCAINKISLMSGPFLARAFPLA